MLAWIFYIIIANVMARRQKPIPLISIIIRLLMMVVIVDRFTGIL